MSFFDLSYRHNVAEVTNADGDVALVKVKTRTTRPWKSFNFVAIGKAIRVIPNSPPFRVRWTSFWQ